MTQSVKEQNDRIESQYGNPETFVSRVKQELWDSDITQTALAAEAGYDLTNVNRWLNKRVTPSLKVMITLDEALERLKNDRMA